ncbi:hypothetical protein E5S67_00397 [Microcoleus sp. IPMA8]|uniref:Uncharacterized protein n=1 Tax=Microcoleus asticus IPMA8 TaxID=2563858 RepID=A0ABX2CQK4_9CYAN|nr:hypothetical protein [Microcoleus asticus IPMA8]
MILPTHNIIREYLVIWSRKIQAVSEDLASKKPPPKKRGVLAVGGALLLEKASPRRG